ncbi:four helix bundle protein [Caloranaerobacter sp. TR13]|uniref:four helix bundle protein n=1 Tax=Caloranaerobacter sp. TR13 TaxID=1302151 RepID=UPI000AB9DBFE|nr:four helix bundle protein [Caloranaerobacter sp. TR13]
MYNLAHELTINIYKITRCFPDDEKFSLVSQLRRASLSIPTNIAEGSGQLSKVNYIRFLGIARGSSFEVEYLLKLSKDFGYLNEEYYKQLNQQNESILRMLNGLIKSLKG